MSEIDKIVARQLAFDPHFRKWWIISTVVGITLGIVISVCVIYI